MKTKIEFSDCTVKEYDTTDVYDIMCALRDKSKDIKAKCEPILFVHAAEMLDKMAFVLEQIHYWIERADEGR